MRALYRQAMTRELALVQMGYKVETMCECEWRRQVMEDMETRELMTDIDKSIFETMRDPINPRDALHGGRVDCYRLWWNVHSSFFPGEGVSREELKKEHLEYMDVTSLYPFVNKYKSILQGIP